MLRVSNWNEVQLKQENRQTFIFNGKVMCQLPSAPTSTWWILHLQLAVLSPNPAVPMFWHQGPVFVDNSFSVDGGGGGWFQDDSSALNLLCTLFFLWLHQLHLRSQALDPRNWGPWPNPLCIHLHFIPGAPAARLPRPWILTCLPGSGLLPYVELGPLQMLRWNIPLCVMLLSLMETLTSHFPPLNLSTLKVGCWALCFPCWVSICYRPEGNRWFSDLTACVATICSCPCHTSAHRLHSLGTGVSPDGACVGWTAHIMYWMQCTCLPGLSGPAWPLSLSPQEAAGSVKPQASLLGHWRNPQSIPHGSNFWPRRDRKPGGTGRETACPFALWWNVPDRIQCFHMVSPVYAKLLQSCPTLYDPVDCGPPGSSVHGILQARILEWVAISFSRRSSPPRDGSLVSSASCISKRVLYH